MLALKWGVSSLMRVVSKATWTSGLPVSLAARANCLMTSVLLLIWASAMVISFSLANATARNVPHASCLVRVLHTGNCLAGPVFDNRLAMTAGDYNGKRAGDGVCGNAGLEPLEPLHLAGRGQHGLRRLELPHRAKAISRPLIVKAHVAALLLHHRHVERLQHLVVIGADRRIMEVVD